MSASDVQATVMVSASHVQGSGYGVCISPSDVQGTVMVSVTLFILLMYKARLQLYKAVLWCQLLMFAALLLKKCFK
jgi:hypothetical protein